MGWCGWSERWDGVGGGERLMVWVEVRDGRCVEKLILFL